MLLSLSILYGALLSLGAAADRNWPYHTFETGPWQPPKLSLNKTGDVNPGSFFISVRNPSAEGSAPTIYDDNGDLVYAGPEETTMDFKMQTLYGQDVITFWSGETHVAAGYGYGKVHILDNTYKEIHTVTLQDHFTTPDGKQRDSYIDLHEHIITPRNTMIVTAINITQADLTPVGGKPGQWAIASHFYEIDIATNKVVFAWNALDHQDGIPISKSRQTLKGTGTTQDTPYDIFHMNSVTPTDHGYLVSIRYMWSAFYLNKDGTVRWQLAGTEDGDGDFKGDGVRFSWQHDMRVHNETDKGLVLSLFNNAHHEQEKDSVSTGMTFNLDLVDYTASNMRNDSDPNDPQVADTQGSFQYLPDAASASSHSLLDYGNDPVLKEFDGAGNIVLTAQFGAGPAESYRGFKFQWSATPYWKPAVVAKKASDGTTDVYMSWNGATEHDSWAIYSSDSQDARATTFVGAYPRTGFETHVSLKNVSDSYIQVAARRGKTTLRKSNVVAV